MIDTLFRVGPWDFESNTLATAVSLATGYTKITISSSWPQLNITKCSQLPAWLRSLVYIVVASPLFVMEQPDTHLITHNRNLNV